MASANLASRLHMLRLLLPQRPARPRHEVFVFRQLDMNSGEKTKANRMRCPARHHERCVRHHLEPHGLFSVLDTSCLKRRLAYASTPFLVRSTYLLSFAVPS